LEHWLKVNQRVRNKWKTTQVQNIRKQNANKQEIVTRENKQEFVSVSAKGEGLSARKLPCDICQVFVLERKCNRIVTHLHKIFLTTIILRFHSSISFY